MCQETKMYEQVCKQRFDDLFKHNMEAKTQLDRIEKRLFFGNGEEAWTTTISNIRRSRKVQTAITVGVAIALVGWIAKEIIAHVYGN